MAPASPQQYPGPCYVAFSRVASLYYHITPFYLFLTLTSRSLEGPPRELNDLKESFDSLDRDIDIETAIESGLGFSGEVTEP